MAFSFNFNFFIVMLCTAESVKLFGSQSTERNLVLKQSKYVSNDSTVPYFNLDYAFLELLSKFN